LKIIATTFSRVLRASHHQRIKYHQSAILELENKIREKHSQLFIDSSSGIKVQENEENDKEEDKKEDKGE